MNILPGAGSAVGQYIAEHPGIGKVSFTGSTDVGRGIVRASAGNLKRVQLELGGKGANIVFGDATVNAAVNGSAFAIFHNQGQACIAGSRLILHESIADEFIEKFIKLATSIKIGNPLDRTTELGPLTSLGHRDKVLGLLQDCRGRGRQDPHGRQGAQARRPRPGLLRRAHARRGQAQRARLERGGLRPFRRRHAASRPTRKRCKSPTAPSTVWAADCGPTTCHAHTCSHGR